MFGKGRVTQIEEALKTIVGDLPPMASTASVAKPAGVGVKCRFRVTGRLLA